MVRPAQKGQLGFSLLPQFNVLKGSKALFCTID